MIWQHRLHLLFGFYTFPAEWIRSAPVRQFSLLQRNEIFRNQYSGISTFQSHDIETLARSGWSLEFDRYSMDITLRQIKYFIAAAETGKIAAAANMLSISPSSITESIKELESITGVTLITRHHRGINLTFDGYRFLQHCHNINASVSNAEYALKNSYTDISGDLTLGITITVAGYFLASH